MIREADAVIVGLGWAGGILAAELTRAGLEVIALERGPRYSREDGDFGDVYDEMDVRRRRFMQDVRIETWTLRHDESEPALPFRRLGAFTPGNGVGGSSLLYGGHTGRYLPWDFTLRSSLTERYGADVMPEGSTVADWGITYDELAPYYERFEDTVGTASRAGRLRGRTMPGGNPFEGDRGREFPLPPGPSAFGPQAFADAASRLGLHPFPMPTAAIPQPYTNRFGVSRPACTECGFCAAHPCENGSKGEATSTVLPAAMATGRLRVVENAYAVRVVHDGRRARGVEYIDSEGRLVEQRAQTVILSAYSLSNTRLLLLSGLGMPYDPSDGTGVVGKNYGTNANAGASVLFRDRLFKNYTGSTTSGFTVDDFNVMTNDPTELGFIGGANLNAAQAGRGAIGRIAVPPGTPRWGAEWKAALREWYDHDVTLTATGQVLPYRNAYMDLDPTYKDAYGLPLLRLTFDWHENERRLVRFMTDRIRAVAEEMGADHLSLRGEQDAHFDTVRYQGTHNTGGAILGVDPASSVVDPWLRLWDVDNVFVVGGSAIPQSSATGPTGTIGALAFRAADGILGRSTARNADAA